MKHIKSFQNFVLEGMITITKKDDDWDKITRDNKKAYQKIVEDELTQFFKKKFKLNDARINNMMNGMTVMYQSNYGGAPDSLKITMPKGSDVDSEKMAKEAEKFLQKLIKTDSRIKGIETSRSYGEKPMARKHPYNSDLWLVEWAPIFLNW
jgi:hypothetical protein